MRQFVRMCALGKMDQADLVAIHEQLLRVRASLRELLEATGQVAAILGTKSARRGRRLSSALSDLVAGPLLPEFRVHADNVACLFADLRVSGPRCATGVDGCFGRTLFDGKTSAQDSHANLGEAQVLAAAADFEKRARAFIKSVRALPHESCRTRLDACEARFDASWRKVAHALRDST